MKPLHLFAPLRRQPGYLATTTQLSVGNVAYDLLLPSEISDLLLTHFVDAPGSYRRVDRYCDTLGIDQIHARPTLLDAEYNGVPTFAISFNGVEDVLDDEDVVGYVALRLAVGPLAARQLYNRAVSRTSITPTLADYVGRRETFFRLCGGFELLRLRYYLDAADRYEVMLDLEANEPPTLVLRERPMERTRFTSFNNRLSTICQNS